MAKGDIEYCIEHRIGRNGPREQECFSPVEHAVTTFEDIVTTPGYVRIFKTWKETEVTDGYAVRDYWNPAPGYRGERL